MPQCIRNTDLYAVAIAAINQRLLIIPESARCTLDTLNQILYDKTEDGGKEDGVFYVIQIVFYSNSFSYNTVTRFALFSKYLK